LLNSIRVMMERKSSWRFLSLRALIAALLSTSGFFMGLGTLSALLSPEARANGPERMLTFAERVSYQRAIEEVYWRHRIWPKDNRTSKPPLDATISAAQLEQKVAAYLCKSRVVTALRGFSIASNELQEEMDRMASHSIRPKVLRELFQSLGNDPFVIAECLAKPILAEHVIRNFRNSSDHVIAGNGTLFTVPDSARPAVVSYEAAYILPEISAPTGCTDDAWTATSTATVPDARWGHTAVWTGSEMIVWGGNDGGSTYFNTGGRYDPATDSWTTTSTVNAPTARWLHSAVWTGGEMIVWGGYGGNDELLNTGGRYDPTTDSWTAISAVDSPTPRSYHTAVWTGSEMIVWGGRNDVVWMNSGGRYNPGTDSWTATNTINAPEARWDHSALWSGSEMVVWGGTNQTIYLNTGGRYNPNMNSWTPTNTVNAPLGRIAYTALWTDSEMIVWGGVDENFNETNTGGKYNPTMDSWTDTSLDNAPSPRDSHGAVWTGSEMVVWGGVFCCPPVDFNSGGRYDVATDNWTATNTAGAPLARWAHTAVWTGSEMIAWGGYNDAAGMVLNTGGKYCALSTATPTPTATATGTPTPRPSATATATPRIAPTPRARPTPRPRL
jgi:N-acetylneuraminic acid mutarotase